MSKVKPLLEEIIDPRSWSLTGCLFSSVKDSEPKPFTMPLEKLLGTQHQVVQRKEDAQLFSPVQYKEGTSRGKRNVEKVFALVFDIDGCRSEDLQQCLLSLKPWAFVAYTSFSHDNAVGEWNGRILLPLVQPIPQSSFSKTYAAFEQNYIIGADPNAKDISRLFYLPSTTEARIAHANIIFNPGTLFEAEDAFLPVGQRNGGLLSVAGRLRRRGADEDTITQHLLQRNRLCDPPLDEDEVRAIARSIMRYDPETDSSGVAEVEGKYSLAKLQRVFREDEEFKDRFSWDSFNTVQHYQGAPITDPKVTEIEVLLSRRYPQWKVPRYDLEHLIEVESLARPFHPVAMWLESLVWDGTSRLGGLAREFWAAEHEIENVYLRKWMIGAVARAMDPGCKNDNALILYGEQGIGKSRFFASMCPQDSWFSDSPLNLNDARDLATNIHGKWIYEWAELESFRRAREINTVKAVLSSRVDTYTPKYARRSVSIPRSCVFVGSTNERNFLVDETGHRRFCVVECKKECDIEALVRVRDQLWAEAVRLFRGGEVWHLGKEELKAQAERNSEFEPTNNRYDDVVAYLTRLGFPEWVGIKQMYDGVGCSVDAPYSIRREISNAARKTGYEQKTRKIDGNAWKWFKKVR